jgi:hypothetical protein
MLKQKAQTTKAYKSSPAHMHTPPEQVPTMGTNRSGWFPKLVRSVTKTGQADCQNRSNRFGTADHTPQKPKMQKKCTSSPLTLGIGSRDAMQLFSTLLSPPCCQCMNQSSNLKTCKASQVYKNHHKMLHMSK